MPQYVLDFLTPLLAFVALIVSAYFAHRSAVASESSARSSEASARSATESIRLAGEMLEIQRDFSRKTVELQEIGLVRQQEQNEKAAEHANRSLGIQREHNYKSVTPILRIWAPDHNEEVSVKLFNDGLGPLIITSLTVSNGTETNSDFISWMPRHPKGITYWTTFIGEFGGEVSILPGSFLPLLLLENEDENDPDFVLFRREVRKHLSKLIITVEGKDIYDRPIMGKTHSLKWFGRTIPHVERDSFSLTLTGARGPICSAVEWDRRVAEIERTSPHW